MVPGVQGNVAQPRWGHAALLDRSTDQVIIFGVSPSSLPEEWHTTTLSLLYHYSRVVVVGGALHSELKNLAQDVGGSRFALRSQEHGPGCVCVAGGSRELKSTNMYTYIHVYIQ